MIADDAPTRAHTPLWGGLYLSCLLVAVVIMAYVGSGWERVGVVVGVALIVAEYRIAAGTGSGLARRESRPGASRIGLLIGGLTVSAAASPMAVALLPVVVPRVFLALRLGPAMAAAGVLFAVCAASLQLHGVEPRGWTAVPLAVGFLLCVVAGAWISQVMSLSEARAQSLAALRQSQAEIARMSRQAGVTAERSRMAQEVHDGVTQRLAVIRMLLEASQLRHEAGAYDEAHSRVAMAYEQVLGALGELRAVLAKTADAEDPGEIPSFTQSVESSVQAVAAGAGLQSVTRVAVDDDDLPPDVRSVLVRVLREALSNVAAHAQARVVEVSVTRSGPAVVLQVSDDGIGLAAAEVGSRRAGHGLGVSGMQRRAAAAGGHLNVEGRPGGGTVVTAQIPLGPPARTTEPAAPTGDERDAIVGKGPER